MMNRLIACGEQHSVCLSSDGSAWYFGSWFWKADEVCIPKRIDINVEVIEIDCGEMFVVLLDSNSEVWSYGGNFGHVLGRKGLKESVFEQNPRKVKGLPQIASVSCGYQHTLCVGVDGSLWGFGQCGQGQLGISNPYPREVPIELPVTDIVAAACGASFSVIQNFKGDILVSGKNKNGQLGIGISASQEQHGFDTINLEHVVSFSCGAEFVLYVTSEGFVYGAGHNYFGQLGLGCQNMQATLTKIPDLSDIVSVSCGKNHSMCIDSEQNLWTFGFNESGRLGLGDSTTRYRPEKVPDVTPVVISGGGAHTILKDFNGTIRVCGKNGVGQLAMPKCESILSFMALDQEYSSIIGIHPKNRAKSARK